MWDTNIKGDHEQVKGIKIRMARSLYSTLIVFAWEPLRSKISRLASQSCSRALVTKRHKEHMIVEFTELGLRKIFRLGNLPRLDRRGGNLLVIYSTWHNHVVCSVNFLILNFRSIEKSLSSSDGSPWASWRRGLGWGVSEISPVGSFLRKGSCQAFGWEVNIGGDSKRTLRRENMWPTWPCKLLPCRGAL